MKNKLPFEVKEIRAKGILSKCGIPGIDWVVNPYIGCRFGCKYCYASFMGRFVGACFVPAISLAKFARSPSPARTLHMVLGVASDGSSLTRKFANFDSCFGAKLV